MAKRFSILDPKTDAIMMGFASITLDNGVFMYLTESKKTLEACEVGARVYVCFHTGMGSTDAVIVREKDKE